MMKATWMIFLILCISPRLAGQTTFDSSVVFEKARGTLLRPVRKFKEVPPVPVEEEYQHLMPKFVTYLCMKRDSVRAIFEGKIVSIEEISGSYMLMTRYGNYKIGYYGLSKPAFKEGDFIKRNQFVAVLSESIFAAYFLNIHFYKDDIELDPNDWFK